MNNESYWQWPSVLDCLKCGGTRTRRGPLAQGALLKCESCQGTGIHAIPMEEVINWRERAQEEMPWWDGADDES